MIWRGLPFIVSAGLHNVTDISAEDDLRAIRGGSFGLGSVVEGALRYVSIPLPGDGAEVHKIPVDTIRRRIESPAHAPAGA